MAHLTHPTARQPVTIGREPLRPITIIQIILVVALLVSAALSISGAVTDVPAQLAISFVAGIAVAVLTGSILRR